MKKLFIVFFSFMMMVFASNAVSAHSVSTTSGTGWKYVGNHNFSSTIQFFMIPLFQRHGMESIIGFHMRMLLLLGMLTKDSVTFDSVTSGSLNKVGVYSSSFSSYYAFHQVDSFDPNNKEHQMEWEIC